MNFELTWSWGGVGGSVCFPRSSSSHPCSILLNPGIVEVEASREPGESDIRTLPKTGWSTQTPDKGTIMAAGDVGYGNDND